MTSIVQIAELAGVSNMTVSNVLSGRVQPKRPDAVARAERIRRIADELGYRPNVSAQAIRTGRFRNLSLLLPTRHHLGFASSATIEGLVDAADEYDYSITVSRQPDDVLTDGRQLPTAMRKLNSDGAVVNYWSNSPAAMRDVLAEYNIPAIWINSPEKADCVRPDDFAGGRLITEYLLKLGHRRICYAAFQGDGHYSMVERGNGYAQAMQDAGLQTRFATGENGKKINLKDAISTIRSVLDSPERPTAMVCYGQGEFFATLTASALLSISLPQDLSTVIFDANVVSGDGYEVTQALTPERTTALEAIHLLMKKIEEPTVSFDPILVPFSLREAASCFPPPKR